MKKYIRTLAFSMAFTCMLIDAKETTISSKKTVKRENAGSKSKTTKTKKETKAIDKKGKVKKTKKTETITQKKNTAT